ncbi:tRNA pseudouridine(38-40) synthase TruA [Alphaproteobacteria bacterium]|nr:tRNA pseudouridine(38-40) synthase TruA [Alphaproteobacteria bacterium]
MPRYKITVEYLGTNFSGWQKQKNCLSIQEAIEKSAKKLLQQDINLVVAGRTDAGVHAEGQVAHLDVKNNFCSRKMLLGINFYLLSEKFGKDISIKKVTKVSTKFNARFSAKKKIYQYLIFNSDFRSAHLNNKSWWVRKPIDQKKITMAAKYLLGCHDFSSFRARGCQAKTPIRTIDDIKIYQNKKVIKIKFTGRSFLYNQVRIIVGTLKEIGTSSTDPMQIKKILESQNRKNAGVTAPPEGLTLKKVYY